MTKADILEINLTNNMLDPKGLSEISDTSDQTFPSPLRAIPNPREKVRCFKYRTLLEFLLKAVARPWTRQPYHQHAFRGNAVDIVQTLFRYFAYTQPMLFLNLLRRKRSMHDACSEKKEKHA